MKSFFAKGLALTPGIPAARLGGSGSIDSAWAKS
jgi:hypothetical protein